MSSPPSNILGSSFQYGGIGWPWGNSLKSYWETKSDHDVLSTSIQMIILTMLGERVMLNDFGSEIYELVFDPSDVTMSNQLTSIANQVIPKWDPRLDVVSVNVRASDREDSRVDMSVVYRNKTDPKSGPVSISFSVSK